MAYLILLILIVLGTGVATLLTTKGWRVVSIAAGSIVVLLMTLIFSINIVGAGHVGVIYRFGNIVGQTGSGTQFVAPWESVTVASVQVQAAQFTLSSFSKETQDVTIYATLNYSIAPKDITGLYRNIGPNWFNIIIPTRVNQVFKDETVKYLAVDIAPNRNQIRNDVLAKLTSVLAPYSVQVDGLNIDNITFSTGFTNAIEDKQIATQQAEAAENRVKTAEAQAKQVVALAEGQAKANHLQEETLTPLVVENNWVSKLAPGVKVYVVNGSSDSILPLGGSNPSPTIVAGATASKSKG